MTAVLRLYEDVLSNGAEARLPPLSRMIFVLHGMLALDDRTYSDGEAWHGGGAAAMKAGTAGVSCWRYELSPDASSEGTASGPGVRSTLKLSAKLDTLPAGELLLRGDSVGFPPAGCAFQHRHAGPGIRCLLEGGIRIDTHGRSTSHGPGGAWFETGPDVVFAQAAADRPSRFIRVMILPRALIGKSSFQYVNEADKEKPRVQQYKILADFPIERPAGT
ncbi:MAG: hypothetical protein ACJ8F3_07855 [Xanthobacteraceae bacterium]